MSEEQTPEGRRRAFRVVSGGAEGPRALPPGADEAEHKAERAGSKKHAPEDMPSSSQAALTSARVLAPGAPPSPGTAPLEIARHLRMGEALVWWDTKTDFDLRPLVWIGGVSAVVLVGASALAPEFWGQPLADLWRPIAVLLSPMLLWLIREQMSLRSIMVTDTAILEVPRRGEPQRLQFTAVQQVRRDLWTGGIMLIGKSSRVRVPAALIEAARAAVASQRKRVLRGSDRPDDAVGFFS